MTFAVIFSAVALPRIQLQSNTVHYHFCFLNMLGPNSPENGHQGVANFGYFSITSNVVNISS